MEGRESTAAAGAGGNSTNNNNVAGLDHPPVQLIPLLERDKLLDPIFQIHGHIQNLLADSYMGPLYKHHSSTGSIGSTLVPELKAQCQSILRENLEQLLKTMITESIMPVLEAQNQALEAISASMNISQASLHLMEAEKIKELFAPRKVNYLDLESSINSSEDSVAGRMQAVKIGRKRCNGLLFVKPGIPKKIFKTKAPARLNGLDMSAIGRINIEELENTGLSFKKFTGNGGVSSFSQRTGSIRQGNNSSSGMVQLNLKRMSSIQSGSGAASSELAQPPQSNTNYNPSTIKSLYSPTSATGGGSIKGSSSNRPESTSVMSMDWKTTPVDSGNKPKSNIVASVQQPSSTLDKISQEMEAISIAHQAKTSEKLPEQNNIRPAAAPKLDAPPEKKNNLSSESLSNLKPKAAGSKGSLNNIMSASKTSLSNNNNNLNSASKSSLNNIMTVGDPATPQTPAAGGADETDKPPGYVQALYDYTAATENEISFQAGQLILVTDWANINGWTAGTLYFPPGQEPDPEVRLEGYFPVNYVKELER